MVNWMNRIDISDEVAALAYEGHLDSLVTFVYIHKSGRETCIEKRLYDAILLAERRMADRRYKNYSIYIY